MKEASLNRGRKYNNYYVLFSVDLLAEDVYGLIYTHECPSVVTEPYGHGLLGIISMYSEV